MPTEFQFIVAIVEVDDSYSIEKNLLCTGSLLTKSHILTCEHCFEEIESQPFRILAGSNSLIDATAFFPLFWISFDQWAVNEGEEIVYPENDIAMIKLIVAVPDECPTVTLATFSENEDLYGLWTVTAGWGQIKNDILPIILHKAIVKIITNENCENIIKALAGEECPVPEELYICTKNLPYTHLGEGDSGGPLLYENNLVGINKALCPDIDFSTYQVNAHLSIHYYRTFIASTITT
ncbi:PREDICTED: chymotrypsin-2-like [Ceratosolen solmsi marchali]|uniref:Chymotrypsin-2-like n=1 Tax=Ceratosolen solmsi marchali TaxID=326594 RepID=A0AAJ6YHU5_9HYME|nr:PREDICTED: chymotrypsin-2-like [Ceratosolen solmsi marchali]